MRLDYKSKNFDREEKQKSSYQQILTGQKLSGNSQTNSHQPDKVPTSCSDPFLPEHLFLINWDILSIYHCPEINSIHLQEIEVDSTPCVLEILDTAGTEQFASMRDLYIKNGQGFVVVYSLTNHQTFQDIKTMRDQIVRVKGCERVPILLVGNKVDLESQREVPTVEGMALAQIWGCPFVEASARHRINVNEVFAETVREMNMKPESKDREIICTCCCIS